MDFPEDIPDLPLGAEARHELALSVREALTNVVRHSRATEVTLILGLEKGVLAVWVRDNGQGMPDTYSNGDGLKNMQARMEKAGGSFGCAPADGGGTVVTFRVPLPRPAAGRPL
jgi:signal transduction histidine kinase